MALKIDYKDYIPPTTGRVYRPTYNTDGTMSLTDATDYQQVGDQFGAAELNWINSCLANMGCDLLDNSNFARPVNQRDVSGTISTTGYFIDRWKLASGTVVLTDDGITLNGTITQILECAAGTQVTISFGMVSGTATGSYDNATKTLTVASAGGELAWAKLEVGSVATPYVPKGYGAELAECMRYYQRFTDMNLSGIVYCANGDTRGMGFVLPVPMRIAPSVPNAVAADGFAFVVSDTRSDINQSISSKSFETNQGFVTVRNLQFTNAGLYGGVATIAVKFTLVELSADL